MAPANLSDGRAIAAQLLGELSQRIAALKSRGIQPGLAFVRVGEDAASRVYVGRKEKTSAEFGSFSETHVLPEATSEADLLKLFARFNTDSRLAGDVAFVEVQAIASRTTLNPEGVGPMTIAMLMQNTVRAAEMTLS